MQLQLNLQDAGCAQEMDRVSVVVWMEERMNFRRVG